MMVYFYVQVYDFEFVVFEYFVCFQLVVVILFIDIYDIEVVVRKLVGFVYWLVVDGIVIYVVWLDSGDFVEYVCWVWCIFDYG